jgi:hypothetical protein
MEEIPCACVVLLSMLADRKRPLGHAQHVIDTMSLGNAVLHVQQVFKHLVGTSNIVRDGFKAPYPLPFPPGFNVGWVRLRHRRPVKSITADKCGWKLLQTSHIIGFDASNGKSIQCL